VAVRCRPVRQRMHEIYLLDHFTSANVEGTYSHLGFIHVGPKVGGTLAPAALLSRFRFVISVGQQISTYKILRFYVQRLRFPTPW